MSFFGGPTKATTEYQDRDQLMNYINQGMSAGGIAKQKAPQLSSITDAFRGAQIGQLNNLRAVASGSKGAGEMAAERQFQNANAAQQSMARSARGGANAALAYRNAANQSAALGSSAAGAGQQAAAQDAATANATLANVANAGRAGDFSTNNANAGYQAQTNGQNAQNYLALMSSLSGMNHDQLQAQQAAAQDHGMFGSLLQAAGPIAGAAMMSDRRLKTNVTDARDSVDQLMDSMSPKGFDYKEPERFGPGMDAGVMAQDLERSDAGKSMVQETPDGKAIDMKRAVAAALAATARLNERLRAVEKR